MNKVHTLFGLRTFYHKTALSTLVRLKRENHPGESIQVSYFKLSRRVVNEFDSNIRATFDPIWEIRTFLTDEPVFHLYK